jgi:TonB family protein
VTRATLLLACLVAAPAAQAWVPCEQKGLVPPKPIQREAPAYPQAVRETGIEGSVEVALTVLRDGNVGWVRVVQAEPRGFFEQAAADGVRRWRFTPAMQDGEAVECRLLTRVRFALTDSAATAAGAAAGERPQPVYPPALLAARVEGYVEVEYDLAADGAVSNARLAAAMPRGEFEKAALAAVRAWHGPPGAAGRHESRRFDFRLPDTSLDVVPPTMLASAPFPLAACERRQSGRVVLEVETDAGGQVRAARILAADPPGLFDQAALTIARGSRLSPAWRDGQPVPATALLALPFAPERATCPNLRGPDRERRPSNRPPPRVTGSDGSPPRHDEAPGSRAEAIGGPPRRAT